MSSTEINPNKFYFQFALITIITTILSSIVIVLGPLGTIFMLIFVFYFTGLLIKFCKNPSGDYFNAMLLGLITGFFASISSSIATILVLKSVDASNAFDFILKNFFSYLFNLSCDLLFNIPVCIICALISTGFARGIFKGNNE